MVEVSGQAGTPDLQVRTKTLPLEPKFYKYTRGCYCLHSYLPRPLGAGLMSRGMSDFVN